MAALASDWLRHFRLLLWNCWTEFNETWQKARSQRSLPSLCFLGRLEKEDGRPGLWLAETFSSSSLKPLNGIQWNLTGSKISMSSTKFVFFGPIWKTRWPPWPLIGWDIFDFSSETAERNSTKLDRKQDLNVLYQVCVFWADRKKEYGHPGLWLAETFSTSPLKPLNGIKRNLTGSKFIASSTKFVFFGPIRKTRWRLWLLIGWDIFHFSSETAERNSKKLDKKQDLNVLYQVCIFCRSVNKNGHPGRLLKMVAHCTQVHDMWPFGPLVTSSLQQLHWLIFFLRKDREFKFDMHTALMKPLEWHQGQWPFDLYAKNSFSDFVASGGIVFHKCILFHFATFHCFISRLFTDFLTNCTDNCSDPPVYQGLPPPSYVSTMYGDVASYDCGYGQNPSNFPTTAVCNTTGWSSVPYFTCQDVGK